MSIFDKPTGACCRCGLFPDAEDHFDDPLHPFIEQLQKAQFFTLNGQRLMICSSCDEWVRITYGPILFPGKPAGNRWQRRHAR